MPVADQRNPAYELTPDQRKVLRLVLRTVAGQVGMPRVRDLSRGCGLLGREHRKATPDVLKRALPDGDKLERLISEALLDPARHSSALKTLHRLSLEATNEAGLEARVRLAFGKARTSIEQGDWTRYERYIQELTELREGSPAAVLDHPEVLTAFASQNLERILVALKGGSSFRSEQTPVTTPVLSDVSELGPIVHIVVDRGASDLEAAPVTSEPPPMSPIAGEPKGEPSSDAISRVTGRIHRLVDELERATDVPAVPAEWDAVREQHRRALSRVVEFDDRLDSLSIDMVIVQAVPTSQAILAAATNLEEIARRHCELRDASLALLQRHLTSPSPSPSATTARSNGDFKDTLARRAREAKESLNQLRAHSSLLRDDPTLTRRIESGAHDATNLTSVIEMLQEGGKALAEVERRRLEVEREGEEARQNEARRAEQARQIDAIEPLPTDANPSDHLQAAPFATTGVTPTPLTPADGLIASFRSGIPFARPFPQSLIFSQVLAGPNVSTVPLAPTAHFLPFDVPTGGALQRTVVDRNEPPAAHLNAAARNLLWYWTHALLTGESIGHGLQLIADAVLIRDAATDEETAIIFAQAVVSLALQSCSSDRASARGRRRLTRLLALNAACDLRAGLRECMVAPPQSPALTRVVAELLQRRLRDRR